MSLFAPMYHSISREPCDDLFTLEESNFAAHLRWLKLTGHQPVTLSQIADWLDGRSKLPQRAYIITFDDGYLDNLTYALPLLEEYKASACIFVTTGWSGEEERGYAPLGTEQRPMLTWSEMKYLASHGVEIGAHTVHHPFLPELDQEEAWKEISQCKLELEEKVGVKIQAFSYPNSQHNAHIRDLVRQAGYTLAFGGNTALNTRRDDRYELARPCIYNGCGAGEFTLSLCTGLHLRERYWKWRKNSARQTEKTPSTV